MNIVLPYRLIKIVGTGVLNFKVYSYIENRLLTINERLDYINHCKFGADSFIKTEPFYLKRCTRTGFEDKEIYDFLVENYKPDYYYFRITFIKKEELIIRTFKNYKIESYHNKKTHILSAIYYDNFRKTTLPDIELNIHNILRIELLDMNLKKMREYLTELENRYLKQAKAALAAEAIVPTIEKAIELMKEVDDCDF